MEDECFSNLMVSWLDESDELLISFMDEDLLEVEEQFILDYQTAYELFTFLQKKFRKIIKVPAEIDDKINKT